MSISIRPDPARGVMETMLVLEGAPVELEAHLDRLGRSAKELFGAELPPEARRLVLEHARALPLGRIRLTVAPDPAGVLRADTVTASVDPGDVFPSWERAVSLRAFPVRGGLGAHKWADRAALAEMESSLPRESLPLLVDADNEVLEASRANLFALAGETLITPAADGRILPGVARARAIEAARSLGCVVREQALTIEDLVAAGQAFLTGSVRGLEPVRAVSARG